MARGGTTTIEIKTGYALTTEGEVRPPRNDRHGGGARARPLVPTLLAHLVPPDRRADRDAFVREICEQWIPRAAARNTADTAFVTAVDVWCEDAAFTLRRDPPDSCTRLLQRTSPCAGHVGQLSDIERRRAVRRLPARVQVNHLPEYVGETRAIAALAPRGHRRRDAARRVRPAPVAAAAGRETTSGGVSRWRLPRSQSRHELERAARDADVARDHALRDDRRRSVARRDAPRGAGAAASTAVGTLVPRRARGDRRDLGLRASPTTVPYRYGTNLASRVITRRGLDVVAK